MFEKNLFGFFVSGVLFALFAKLLKLKTSLQRFLVFVRKIIRLFALGAFQFDEVVL